MSTSASTWLLALGAFTGLALALAGAVRPPAAVDPGAAGAVASVDGSAIAAQDYASRLEAYAQDRREELTSEDREAVLHRLIDEELLLGRALAMDLPRQDPALRAALLRTVIENVISLPAPAPDDDTLREFLERNSGYFTPPPRLDIARLVFLHVHGTAAERAQAAATRLGGGEDFAAVGEALADADPLPLPRGTLPLRQWQHMIGEPLAAAARRLPSGGISEPLATPDGYAILWVRQRQDPPPPELEPIRELVAREYRRHREEQVLEAYLERLRHSASIRIYSGAGNAPP